MQRLGIKNALVLSTDSTVLGKVKALGMDALLLNPKVHSPHSRTAGRGRG